MSDARRLIDWVTDWLAGGTGLLLMSDYDGTLTPIVSDPTDAWLGAGPRAHLAALARTPQVRLAVVSGRDLEDLRLRVGLPRLIYAGCHGLEIEGPDLSFRHPEAEAQLDALLEVTRALVLRSRAVQGMRVEAKRLAVAVHYRHVPAEAMRHVEIELARAMRQEGSRLKVFHGTKVIEVMPQVGWTKGECALWIRDHVLPTLPQPTMVLYLGDDWTDEHAFEALAGQAITVRVGPDALATRASYRLRGPDEVAQVLAALAAAAGARSEA